MNIFSSFFATKEVEVDDPNVLPPHLRDIYIKPHKILGLNADNPNKDEQIADLREVFRKMCIGLISEFTGFGKGKLSAQQLNLAYHIIRGTVKKSAKYIAENLDNDPFLADFQAEDILPVLRPCLTTYVCNRDYRGFRNFAIRYVDDQDVVANSFVSDLHAESTTTSSTPNNSDPDEERYVFDIHYALRRYRVTKTLAQFLKLNEELEGELLMVPELPDQDSADSSDSPKTMIGDGLAYYVMRVHQTLADRNLFSPRLLNFLGIDYERVQTEEEGAIVAILDTPDLPTGSRWHIIDEKWLLRWRTYVKGRGPRRYYPPGKISNEEILQAWQDFQHYEEEQLKKAREEEEERKKSGKKKDKGGSKASFNTSGSDASKSKGPVRLKLSEHYRCVNYNVWRFFFRVHGGGPNICRSLQDIYTPTPVFSDPDAVVAIQCQMRGYIARKRLNYLQMKSLSGTQVGKKLLLEMAQEVVTTKAQELLAQQHKERVDNLLHEATVFTQTMWRKKKNLFNDEDKLMKRREEQLIFRKAHRYLRDVAQNHSEGVIVEELQPIIHIGGTNIYQRILHDSEGGIPFKIMQKPGTESAMISSAKDESLYFKGSVIRSINHFPTNTLTYLEVKNKLSSATFPLTLVLEKMYSQKNLPLLAELASTYSKQQLREKQTQQREELLRLTSIANGGGPSTSVIANGSIESGSMNGTILHASSSSAIARSVSTDIAMMKEVESSSVILDSAGGTGSAGNRRNGGSHGRGGTGSHSSYDENSHKVGLKDMTNDEKLMYNMFKLALVRGIRLIKHSTTPPWSATKGHFSILRITNQHIYYRSVNTKAIPLDENGHRLPITSAGDEEEDHYAEWTKFSLYSVKYIREGKESKAAVAMGLNTQHCFEIELEDKGSLLFEFPHNHQIKRHLVQELVSYNAITAQNMQEFRSSTTITASNKRQRHPMHFLQTSRSQLQKIIRKRGSISKAHLEDLKKMIEDMERLEDFVEKFLDEKGTHSKRLLFGQNGGKEVKFHGLEEKNKKEAENKEDKASSMAANNAVEEKEDDVTADHKETGKKNMEDSKVKGQEEKKSNDVIPSSPKVGAKSPKNAAGKDDDKSSVASSKDSHVSNKKGKEKVDDKNKAGKNNNIVALNHGVVHLLWQELRYLIREDLERAKIVKKTKEIQMQREKFLESHDDDEGGEEEKNQQLVAEVNGGPALIPEKASDFGSHHGSILSSMSSKILEGIHKSANFLTGRQKKKRRPETKIVLDSEGRAIRVNVIDEMKRKEEILSVVDTDDILAGRFDDLLLEKKCTFTVWNLKRLVDEIRGSQIFIHKSGLPVKRKNPKVTLSRINGGL